MSQKCVRAFLATAVLAVPKLDLFLVQDLSYSFANDLQVLETRLPELVSRLGADYPNSRFGMASFVDKPVEPFGYSISEDYCYKLHLSLTATEDLTDLQAMIAALDTYSGNDWEENQLEAMMHAVRSVSSGWKFEDDRVPILVVSSDAGFHRAGDGPAKAEAVAWSNNAGGFDVDCMHEDYPSMAQVADALNEKDVKVIFLVSPDLVPYYETARQDMGIDGVVMDLRTDSSNIIEAVESALTHMSEAAMLDHTPLKNAHGFGGWAAKSLRSALSFEDKVIQEESRMNADGFSDVERAQLKRNASRFAMSARGARRAPPTSVVAERPELVLSHGGRRLLNCPVRPDHDTRFEVILAQDATDSFADDLPNIQKNVPRVFADIQKQYPDSRFGLAAFVDKPVAPFGYAESGDYCASMRVGLTANMSKIQDSLDSLIVRSGRDWKEAQLHALMHAAYTKKAGWSFDSDYYDTYRVVVLSTDAGFHRDGDSELPANNGDRSQDCEGEDYPSVEQVRTALMYFNIYPVFMVTKEVKPLYVGLLEELDLPGVVVEIDDKSEKFEEALIESLNNVCHQYFPNKPVHIDDHGCHDGCHHGCHNGCHHGCHDGCHHGCHDGCCGHNGGVHIRLAQKPKYLKLVVEN